MSFPDSAVLAEKLESNQSSPDSHVEEKQNLSDSAPQLGDKSAPAPMSLTELDKLEKFKFEGRELTPAELKKAILRQEDYTTKTQKLSEERKTFEQEQKFYENLAWDLQTVRENPALASEFVKMYPEKFHPYLKEVLSSNQPKVEQKQEGQKPDVELMSRLSKLETVLEQQEVQKQTQIINQKVSELSKIYPDALPELALARIYEKYNREGKAPTTEEWETTFQEVDKYMKDLVKTKYSQKVSKQLEANKKASDVEPGGGTLGLAPKKFKNLSEVTNFAVNDLTGKG